MSHPRRLCLPLLAVAATALCLLGQAATAARVAPEDGTAGPYPARAKVTIMSEDFEGTFPTGLWTIDDYDPVAPTAYWGRDDFKPHTGSHSAWVARSGADGRDPAADQYPNNVDSRMWYGPIDLSNYYSAQMDFWYWNKNQADIWDTLFWVAVNDPAQFDDFGDFYGDDAGHLSPGAWTSETLDLSPFCGDPQVWVGFMFDSDTTATDLGAFVDDITVWGIIWEDEQSFTGAGAFDGWVRESGEDAGKGGALNADATTARVGDDEADRQYRAILDFDTSGLPDNAVVTAVTLYVRKQAIVGLNPFDTHGSLVVDMKKGAFHNVRSLERVDFQVAGNRANVGRFLKTPQSAGYAKAALWYRAPLRAASHGLVNLTGVTQFRLRFEKDDNDNGVADYLSFYTGDALAASRPQLIVDYYVP